MPDVPQRRRLGEIRPGDPEWEEIRPATRPTRRPGEIRQGESGWRPDHEPPPFDEAYEAVMARWFDYQDRMARERDRQAKWWREAHVEEATILAEMKAVPMSWAAMMDATGLSLGVLQRKLKRADLVKPTKRRKTRKKKR